MRHQQNIGAISKRNIFYSLKWRNIKLLSMGGKIELGFKNIENLYCFMPRVPHLAKAKHNYWVPPGKMPLMPMKTDSGLHDFEVVIFTGQCIHVFCNALWK